MQEGGAVMLTIGSLFSGIGGLELGLEWAGLGPVLWQVEQDPACRAVLAHHWPNAERHNDVRSVDGAALRPVGLICGGFPCQDVSSAGKKAGLAGARSGLWYEFARIVDELLPRLVVVENVASGADLWLDVVRGDLERVGYASLPVPVAASDCGAPHLRRRIFVVAHRKNPDPLRQRSQGACTGPQIEERERPPVFHWRSPQPGMVRVVDGVSGRLDAPRPRISALGNAVVPQCAEVVGHVIRQLMAEAQT